MITEQAMKRPIKSVGDKVRPDHYAQGHQDKGYWPN